MNRLTPLGLTSLCLHYTSLASFGLPITFSMASWIMYVMDS